VEQQLAAIADELEPLQAREEALFARRLDLMLHGRGLGMTQHDLSVPARVTEGAVTQVFRKHRLRNSV
jgi:hypothetical protein